MPVDKKTARGSRGNRRRKQRTQVAEGKVSAQASPNSSPSDAEISSSSDASMRPPAKAAKVNGRADKPTNKKRKPNGKTTAAKPASSSSSSASSSSSESDSDSESSSAESRKSLSGAEAGNVSSDPGSHTAVNAAAAQDKPDFDAWYLRAVTEQFGSDLEKLRQAPDFKDSSVPMLIDFLQQGSVLFSEEEKRTVMESNT